MRITAEEFRTQYVSVGNARNVKKDTLSENQLQKICVDWFWKEYPEFLIYSIPNGGKRDAREAKTLIRTGVQAGVPDLHIPIARGEYNSLYIEMKVKDNKPTEKQIKMHEKLINFGNKVVVCRTKEEFVIEVQDYLFNYLPF